MNFPCAFRLVGHIDGSSVGIRAGQSRILGPAVHGQNKPKIANRQDARSDRHMVIGNRARAVQTKWEGARVRINPGRICAAVATARTPCSFCGVSIKAPRTYQQGGLQLAAVGVTCAQAPCVYPRPRLCLCLCAPSSPTPQAASAIPQAGGGLGWVALLTSEGR